MHIYRNAAIEKDRLQANGELKNRIFILSQTGLAAISRRV